MEIEEIDKKINICIEDIEQFSLCKNTYTPNKLNPCYLVGNVHS